MSDVRQGRHIPLIVANGFTSTIQVASLGIPDTLFLMLLALVVFGPRRLPEIGRQIGKLMYEFRKVSNDFKYQMEEELRASEETARQEKIQAALPPATNPALPLALETAVTPDADSVYAPSPAALGVPPHPISETSPTPDGLQVPGEVRAESSKYPQIQPPSSGDPVAAQKPFRGRISEPAAPETEVATVTESGAEPVHSPAMPAVLPDEGRIGTELQPGVTSERLADAEREAHHA